MRLKIQRHQQEKPTPPAPASTEQPTQSKPLSWRPKRNLRRLPLAVLVTLLLSLPSAAQNLLQNGDFDTDIAGWVANSGSITFDGGEGSNSGTGSLANQTTSSTSSARQCVSNVVGGTTYSFGADFRLDNGGPINFCRVQLDEYDSSNCSGLSTSQLGSVQQLFPNNSASYTSLASSHTLEASTASVRVRLDCDKNTPSHGVNWDDAFLNPPLIEATRYTLVAGQAAALYQLPGVNGLIGDGDDVPLADPTGLIGSDPNYRGSFSYLAGELAGAPNEPGLPSTYNVAVFLEGTVDFAPGVGAVASNITHTGYRQGFGLQSLIQLTPDVVGAPTGTFLELDAPFSSTGIAYVDNVLIPKATQLGAEGLLFVDATGTLGAPFSISGRGVLFGVRGVPGIEARRGADSERLGGGFADLSVTKTSNVTGLQAPGTFVTFTLQVSNTGPAVANGVVLQDRLLSEVAYQLNNCGAPAPVGGIFTWSVGQLASGGSSTCLVTVRTLDETNFNFPNSAVAYGEEWDPDLDSNVSEVTTEVLDDSSLGTEQLPDQSTGFSSDLDCDSCPTGEQAISDSFKVDSPAQICGLTFYGGYNNNTPFADQFRIEIYDDNRQTPGVQGVPGQLLFSLDGTGFLSRFATGQQIGGMFDEYRYQLAILLEQGATLPRGRYWLFIVNDSSGSATNGDWFWASGSTDVLGRTLPGSAYNPAFTATPIAWGPSPGLFAAYELCLTPFDLPFFADGFESGDTSAWL